MLKFIFYLLSLLFLISGGFWLTILGSKKDPRYDKKSYRFKVLGISWILSIVFLLIAYYI